MFAYKFMKKREMGIMEQMVWLALIIVFALAEMFTVSLTCIWFAGGALAALIASMFGAGLVIQALLFFFVSLLLLFFTRPWAMKYLKPHLTRTNYEAILEQRVSVTERIDNRKETGTAVWKGQEWTARAYQEEQTIEKDALAVVKEIRGVTLYVVPLPTEQDNRKEEEK